MSVKEAAQWMHRALVDQTADLVGGISVPDGGWLRTVRTTLGMTLAQVGQRGGMTRSMISQAEKAEVTGSITIKRLERIANSMGCRVVYAVVPEEPILQVQLKQARAKVREKLKRANVTMSLEDQALTASQIEKEVERLAQALVASGSSRLWDDP